MRTRFVTFVALAALLAAALAPPAAAAPDTLHACDQVNTRITAGNFVGNSSPTRGVLATVNPNYALCTYSSANGAVYEWVGIEINGDNNCGLPGNTGCDPSQALFQIGTVLCNNYAFSQCEIGVPHFFWAKGGCAGIGATPHDLGATNYNQHTYEIRHVSSPQSRYQFWIDSTNTGIYVNANDTAVSCWAGQGHQIGVATGELFDTGNSFGDSNATSIFSVVRYRNTDGSPNISPGWSSTAKCGWQYAADPCDISNVNHDQFYIWSN